VHARPVRHIVFDAASRGTTKLSAQHAVVLHRLRLLRTIMNPDNWEAMKRAAEDAHAVQMAFGHDPSIATPSEMIAAIGQAIHRVIGPYVDTDNGIVDALYDNMMSFEQGQQFAVTTMLAKPADQLTCVGAYRWATSGFPQVTMGHKYAAALMATAVTAEVEPHIVMPWPAFLLPVPNGLVHVLNDVTNTPTEVRYLLVMQLRFKDRPQPGWAFIGFTDSSTIVWRHGPDVTCLIDVKTDETGWSECSFIHSFDDMEKRAMALLGRLICGVCLSMSDPENVKPPRKGRPNVTAEKHPRNAPAILTYQIGKPIVLDCRPAIRNYLEGGRKGGIPQIQVLVRGHWKMQPYGPKHKLRKAIQVQPYWRGPEDAPINMRSHTLGKDEK